MQTYFLKIILAIFLFSTTNPVFSQFILRPSSYVPFKVTESIPAADGGALGISKMDNYKKGSGWNRARYAITLEKYNKQFNKVKENTLANGEGFSTAFFAALVSSDNKAWLVYTEPTEGSNIGNVKAVEINQETLQTGETKLLASESEIGLKLKVQALSELKIYFESSPDKKYHSLFMNAGEEDCFTAGFDSQFKSLWKKKNTLTDFKKEHTVAFAVTNSGETFIISANKKDPSVTMYNSQGKVVNKQLIFGDFTPADISILDNETKGGLTIAGLYMKESDNISGVFKAVLNNATFKIENPIAAEIPEKIIERLKKDGFASTKSKNYGVARREVTNKFYKHNEGTWTQVIEFKHSLGADGRSGTGVGSLLTTAFTNKGVVFAHIPRYAVIPSSEKKDEYATAICKNELILFYKDEAGNLNKSLDEGQNVLKGEKNAVLVAAHIGNDGVITKREKVSSSVFNVSDNIHSYLSNKCN
jgi:hypothetical protein